MSIFVKKPGLSTTVQDLGRTGYLSSGFSPNGAMDAPAACLANILVGNKRTAPVLEFVLAGPTLRFTKPTYAALTGALFSATLNGKPVPSNQAFAVEAGTVLECGTAKEGMFGYLAIANGGVQVPLVMGSASTNLKCGIGGWHGRALTFGDCLPTSPSPAFLPNLSARRVPGPDFRAENEEEPVRIRVVPGPQENLFTKQGVQTFYEKAFKTTSKSDRMGFRLDGPAIETKNGSDIASDGIALGAVQVPAHGRPIIMLADRQTTGGYAKIGTVASVDIPKLVQCRPGCTVCFRRISVQTAQELYRQEEQRLAALEARLQNPGAAAWGTRRAACRIESLLQRCPQTNPAWLSLALAKE